MIYLDTKVPSKPKGITKTALWIKNENCGFRGNVLNGALSLLGDEGKEGKAVQHMNKHCINPTDCVF